MKDDATRLREHDPILPIVKLPEFPAHLQVDYFSHDGSVAHLFPTRDTAHSALPTNDTVLLGNAPKGRIEVGPPFGTDVIVAIASSIPLFPRVRNDEAAQTYLPVLQATIDAAHHRNAKLAARALVLETVP